MTFSEGDIFQIPRFSGNLRTHGNPEYIDPILHVQVTVKINLYPGVNSSFNYERQTELCQI